MYCNKIILFYLNIGYPNYTLIDHASTFSLISIIFSGDMLLAMEDYSAVHKLNPVRTDALLRRALYNYNKKSWLVAVSDFTQLISHEPCNSQARLVARKSIMLSIKSKKNLIYSRNYAEACNEWRNSSLRLSAWVTQLRETSQLWRVVGDTVCNLTGGGFETPTSRTGVFNHHAMCSQPVRNHPLVRNLGFSGGRLTLPEK